MYQILPVAAGTGNTGCTLAIHVGPGQLVQALLIAPVLHVAPSQITVPILYYN